MAGCAFSAPNPSPLEYLPVAVPPLLIFNPLHPHRSSLPPLTPPTPTHITQRTSSPELTRASLPPLPSPLPPPPPPLPPPPPFPQ
ncbi:hypothetical protein HETIRDRAFT_107404 [Heterobasidion irregulare TC 32-1]|uniref:Uncharacterized protein n=1 Tax=Heterobasidion irregulare (strain TC 32-1) TaxID=747525 RepID=W4JW03_HETIT|nr:uncharacterized protein HETIRDRAFT_107404 [Heterobasidion irregulare TC 32-1]ETW77738.1 hypothetical protein HETIRDRAFT_107404 [Heterobasidion irregulare TC 32-1]